MLKRFIITVLIGNSFQYKLVKQENPQRIRNTNKITGFFMVRVSAEICFRTDFKFN